jgi:hypothetical protein
MFYYNCRHALASLHFNENVKRKAWMSNEGNKCYRVMYPKFKVGEEVVREVVVPPTYGMSTLPNIRNLSLVQQM